MVTRSQIKYLYSSKATVFPLGFKMRLIHDHRLLTNTQAKAKAASLKAHQARFLSQMEACSTWEPAALDLIDKQTQANLLANYNEYTGHSPTDLQTIPCCQHNVYT